jgi:hypothetical protein
MSNPHASAPRVDEEPKTPLWLPALGAALFVALAVVWATLPGAPPPVTAVAAQTPGAAGAPPAGAATAPAARAPAPPLPPGHP